MTSGIKAWREIQLSRESSAAQGSATTDFANWRGVGTIQDMRETIFPEEDVGIFGGVDRTYVPRGGSELLMEDTPMTFEQVAHILDAGLYVATPTTDTGTGIIRTYTLPEIASQIKVSTDLQTYSIQGGDNNETEIANFFFVREFNMSGVAGEAWNINATWQGRTTSTDDGFATGLTIPTVEEMLFSKTKLYIDAVGSTHGSNQVSNTMLAATVAVTTGWQAVWSGDGEIYFSFIKQTRPEFLLTLTFEHNSSASAEKDAWRAQTARNMQLKTEGSELTSSGVYTYKTFIQDYSGKWESFDKIGEQDGNDIVVGTFRARYNATAGTYVEYLVVDETAAL